MDWDYVNYSVRPYVDNPSKRIASVNLTEDEEGIVTLVVRIIPVEENNPPQTTSYAEGGIY